MRLFKTANSEVEDPVAEIVARLWQTKIRSVGLLEEWIPKADDFGIKAGLQAHLPEERRHLRLLSAEIARRNGKRAGVAVAHILEKPFHVVRAQRDDNARVFLLHYGIKASNVFYGERLLPLLDPAIARVIEQITWDEDRHIRWARIRLSQERAQELTQDLAKPQAEIEAAMEALWSKPWQRLRNFRYSLRDAG